MIMDRAWVWGVIIAFIVWFGLLDLTLIVVFR